MVQHPFGLDIVGGLVSGNDLIQRISHQHDINPGLLEELREDGVVTGQHDDAPARRLHGGQVADGQRP